MSDIKERLNSQALRIGPGELCADLMIAAGTITELEEQNKELLEALELIVSFVDAGQGTWTLEDQQKARAAIAKAKGEE